ncbi:XrtA system polysaccharide chain length determinant [Marinobacter caseinilyticus]|uniref:XrtA system polysaccharide chain length determinant n=1 Tax=Marinobacter caseinilyticus TaxID=2692195 RepID=UPI00140965E9|nr:XrtA system polysaccharide chain length determinant [Marinobacter caseinilyticus]
MDLQFILETLRAVRLELYRYRVSASITFMLVTAGVLVFGYVTPKTYTSEALLYADQSNILEPLLRGQAEVTQPERINEARELLQSRSFLEQVGLESGLVNGGEAESTRNVIVAGLRQNLNLKVSNRNFLQLSYSSGDPDQSFKVLSAALSRFIERTVRKKRSESQGAYEFIDSQVKAYQRQLEEAEQRLKQFKSGNQDGTEGSVQARIEGLRSAIENLKLEIQQTESEVRLTQRQLAVEEPVRRVTLNPGQSSAERRLAALRQELDSLRLRYHDRHPDVIGIKGQIADLEDQVSGEGQVAREGEVTEVMENPIYESLKLQLGDSRTQLEVKRNRLVSLERLLEEAFERAERVAANQAELSELTRDYTVTRGVYEDMLQRREKARLSMTLDVQGEGVSYRIQEPASYPTRWDGLQLYQVGLAGPFLGSATVLGLLTMLVLFDQRIRSARALQQMLPETILVLTSIPRYSSTWKDRLLRRDVISLLLLLAFFMVGYLGILVFSIMGIELEQIVAKLTELFGSRD